MSDEPKYALYANAHHDLWWTKTQQWSAANWALLLIAGIAGVGRTLTGSNYLYGTYTWPYVVLIVIVGVIAGEYFRRLHGDIAHNRQVYRELERLIGIAALRKQLPGQERGPEETDWKRGVWNLSVMVAAIALASFFAFRLVGIQWRGALSISIGVLLVDLALIHVGALAWKPKEQRVVTAETRKNKNPSKPNDELH